MRHRESDMQIACIRWFRYQYPQYAALMEHPKNEGMGDRRRGAIAKAEGVVPGVADIILHVPAYINGTPSLRHCDSYHSLALEMKTRTGRQSQEQRDWQQYFEAAGGRYVIIRSIDEFQKEVKRYMANVPSDVDSAVESVYSSIENKKTTEALKRFLNITKHNE